jgi:hypothetical protein
MRCPQCGSEGCGAAVCRFSSVPNLGAKVDERRDGSKIEYHVEGDLGSVFKEIRELFKRYPAVAYGTVVHVIQAVYPHTDKFTARMSRSHSCD